MKSSKRKQLLYKRLKHKRVKIFLAKCTVKISTKTGEWVHSVLTRECRRLESAPHE